MKHKRSFSILFSLQSFQILICFAFVFQSRICCGQGINAANDDKIDSSIRFVQTYCVSCHGPDEEEGDRRFDGLAAIGSKENDDVDNRELWREVLDRLNLGDMPPEDADLQPSDEERLEIIELLTDRLSQTLDQEHENDIALRRLNRAEYDRSVRQLLGLETMLSDPTDSFSPDEKKDGFDNIAESLAVTDFLMKQYLQAADQYLAAAIEKANANAKGDADPLQLELRSPFFPDWEPASASHKNVDYMQIRESSGGHGYFLWLKSLAEQNGVPESGYYRVRVKANAVNREHPYKDWIIDTSTEDPIVMSIVGCRSDIKKPRFVHSSDRQLAKIEIADNEVRWYEAQVWLDKGYMLKLGYPNGPRRIKYMRHSLMDQHGDTFPDFLANHVHVFHDMHPDFDKEKAPAMVEAFLAEQDRLKQEGKPYDVFGIDHALHTNEAWTTFHKEYAGPQIRVYEIQVSGTAKTQQPNPVRAIVDTSIDDTKAKSLIKEFATKASRRPINDQQLVPIFDLFDKARRIMNTNDASRLAYKAILCSPNFIYHRTATGPLDQFEIANRMSFFLCGKPADKELLTLARKGRLDDADICRQQTDRLLASPDSKNFISSFLDGWLKLSKLGTMKPDEVEHPRYFNDRLESAMREETILYLDEAFEKNRPIRWFVDGDQTFVNGPLAKLYGMRDIHGHAMRQVKITDPMRGGLLGQASILTATANGIDTSPVIRGVWVLECILGTPPSPPPPDIEPLEPDIRGAVTIREQLSKHRENASCRHCHRRIDPLGFALESFDEIGTFRKEYGDWNEKKLPIDTAGALPSGEEFANIAELRQLLVKQVPLIERNFASKLIVQATGRIDNHRDESEVLKILGQSGNSSGEPLGIREILYRVITSDAFRR